MKKHEKLLVKLMEECGELTQACSKVISNPDNLPRLWAEIQDVKKYIRKVEKEMGPICITIEENIDIDNENTGC